MRKTIVVASFTLVAASLTACDAVQPKPQCKTRRQEYAARYIEMGTPPANCRDKVLTGELLHMATYAPDPTKAGDTPGLGIEPASVADAIEAAEEGMVNAMVESEFSFGKFTSMTPEGDDDVCKVMAMPPTKVSVPMIPANRMTMEPAKPAVSLIYEWTDIRSLVKATSNGLHFGATLKRTDGACVMNYKVSAVTPVIFCGDGKKDTEEIDPKTMKPVVDPATGKPVQVPDPTSGNPVQGKCCPGKVNGLSRDVAYTCEGKTLLCVPAKEFPALDTGGTNLKCTNPDEPM
jgi:hypothetical protein